MMNTSDLNQSKPTRVIPGDEIGPSRSWFNKPALLQDSRQTTAFVKSAFSNSAENQKNLHDAAEKLGYEEGFQQGMQAAENELQSLQDELTATLTLLQNPLEKIDTQVEHELLELALEVSRQILRRELKTDPRHLIGLIRDAVKQLPSSVEEINLHLHPEDAEIINQTLKKHLSDQQWHVIEDPTVPRGECQLHANPSFVHVGIDAVVGQLAAELLGDDRSKTETETETAAKTEAKSK